jgi:YD repeat-containing protein
VTSIEHDLVSLQPIRSTDANHTTHGTDFDGFGRPIRATVAPPGTSHGVVSTMSYLGFANPDTDGRRLMTKWFSDPVAPASVATAAGRTGTVFLDELGRTRRSELALGSDYANEVLMVGSRVYDEASRVVFEADPYPKSQNSASAYGTSYHFKDTGDLNCFIRGRGRQPLNMVTDLATERLPTCLQRSFAGHVDTLDVRDAASLEASSPQAGVVKRPAQGISPDIVVPQDVPEGLKTSADATSEASLRGHLLAEGQEQTGSQSYIPPDLKNDKALHVALDLIHGLVVNPSFPPRWGR